MSSEGGKKNPPTSPENPDSQIPASTSEKPQSAPPSQGVPSKNMPTNMKFVPRESLMNLFPPTSPSQTQNEEPPQEEVDGNRPPNSPVLSDVRSEPSPTKVDKGGDLVLPASGVVLKKQMSRSSDYLPVRAQGKGKSPNDIASSVRLRKPVGGMRKAMSMYQENRKQQHHLAARGKKGSSSFVNVDGGGLGFPVDVGDYGSSESHSNRLSLIDTTTGSSSHSGPSTREFNSAGTVAIGK